MTEGVEKKRGRIYRLGSMAVKRITQNLVTHSDTLKSDAIKGQFFV